MIKKKRETENVDKRDAMSSRNLLKEANMAKQKNAWEAKDWSELEDLVDLETVLKALRKSEDQRVYHKTTYLRKQLILKKAKEAGITA